MEVIPGREKLDRSYMYSCVIWMLERKCHQVLVRSKAYLYYMRSA